jgi:hypothetical protein
VDFDTCARKVRPGTECRSLRNGRCEGRCRSVVERLIVRVGFYVYLIAPENLLAPYWIDLGAKCAKPVDDQLRSNTQLMQ